MAHQILMQSSHVVQKRDLGDWICNIFYAQIICNGLVIFRYSNLQISDIDFWGGVGFLV